MKTGWYRTIEDVKASLKEPRRGGWKTVRQGIYSVLSEQSEPMKTSEIARILREKHNIDLTGNSIGQTLGKTPWVLKTGNLQCSRGNGGKVNESLWILAES